MTRLYIVTLELLSYSDNGCFPESCLMINWKIGKLMIKLLAGWSFINVAPLKFQLTFRTILLYTLYPHLPLLCKGKQLSINCKQLAWVNFFRMSVTMLVQIAFLLLIWSQQKGKHRPKTPPFSLKGKRRRLSIFFSEITTKVQQTISCVMLPLAGRNIGLPRKLKGPRHVFLLHNGIRGVTCSSHTNELMTRDKKETRGFAWTGRWMFLLQSLYLLNWLLLCFHSVSFS